MQIIINSSPVIFLAKLGYLNQFIEYPDDFYIPQSVAEEISAKSDSASQTIQTLISTGKLQVRTSSLITLLNSLNQRLGKGESEAIAFGIELNADYVLLDDSTARREAKRLGLSIISCPLDYLLNPKNPTPPKLCFVSPPRLRGGD